MLYNKHKEPILIADFKLLFLSFISVCYAWGHRFDVQFCSFDSQRWHPCYSVSCTDLKTLILCISTSTLILKASPLDR